MAAAERLESPTQQLQFTIFWEGEEMTGTSTSIEDQWARWDYPTLQALARWDAEDQTRGIISRAQVVQMVGASGEDAWKVGRALDRLEREGLIETGDAMDGTPWPVAVVRITNSGLRQVGAWPTPETLRDRLLTELEAAADRISELEPEKSKRLHQIVEYLRFSATEIISETVAKVLKPGP
ncbi:MAG: PadR family transcriptional regulator [Actinomycetota bacterium]|nr:PadR family transcriptional regulator [Actinomycetota bacterium]